ncbi:MAG: AIR synthase-related protein [Verrucomicrobiales bacterium]|nr:AIR synthase-related protein [Verrucomicrobiales bacterium]
MEALLERITESSADFYRRVDLSGLCDGELAELCQILQLSLSYTDLAKIREIYAEWGRNPTDLELSLIDRFWSRNHFLDGTIEHEVDGEAETIDSLFHTYLFEVSQRIVDSKPTDVFLTDQGESRYIKLDEQLAVSLRSGSPGDEGTPIATMRACCIDRRNGVPSNFEKGIEPGLPNIERIYFGKAYRDTPQTFQGNVTVIPQDEIKLRNSGAGLLDELYEVAETYRCEVVESEDHILKLIHQGETIFELDRSKMVRDTKRIRQSVWKRKTRGDTQVFKLDDPLGDVLKSILSDRAVASRSSYTEAAKEGLSGTVAPVLNSDSSVAVALSLLPEWGKTDPYAMGTASVDRCVRQLIVSGANPDRIALLQNFKAGSIEEPEQLGALVESVKGIAKASEVFRAPFVTLSDSLSIVDGSIPLTALISGVGIVEKDAHVVPNSLQNSKSILAMIGSTENPLGGSVLARKVGLTDACVPETNLRKNLRLYRTLYDGIKCGWIQSAYSVEEGGIAVALAKMGFSRECGLDINLNELPIGGKLSKTSMLFSESPGRVLIEISAKDAHMVEALFAGHSFGRIGCATPEHRNLAIEWEGQTLIDKSLVSLQKVWESSLSINS